MSTSHYKWPFSYAFARRQPCRRRRASRSWSALRPEEALERPARDLLPQIDPHLYRLPVVYAAPDPCVDDLLHQVAGASGALGSSLCWSDRPRSTYLSDFPVSQTEKGVDPVGSGLSHDRDAKQLATVIPASRHFDRDHVIFCHHSRNAAHFLG